MKFSGGVISIPIGSFVLVMFIVAAILDTRRKILRSASSFPGHCLQTARVNCVHIDRKETTGRYIPPAKAEDHVLGIHYGIVEEPFRTKLRGVRIHPFIL